MKEQLATSEPVAAPVAKLSAARRAPTVSPDCIICEKTDKVWTLMLNRTDRANMLNIEILQMLKAHLAAAARDSSLRALIVTANGERVFCSGADTAETGRQANIQQVLWNEVGEALAGLPVLTIAMINGHCIGRAMTLMLACDIRISIPQARFSYPALQDGTLPSDQDMVRLRELIGPGRTSALLLGGQRIHAERALDWGLIDYSLERQALTNFANTLSLVATQADPDHLERIKRLCRESI